MTHVICPFCSAAKTQKIARYEFVDQYECSKCFKRWAEANANYYQLNAGADDSAQAGSFHQEERELARTADLWQVNADGRSAIRCVLQRHADARYRVRVLHGEHPSPLLEHDYTNRHAALAASITIYRRLKDNSAFRNHLRPA